MNRRDFINSTLLTLGSGLLSSACSSVTVPYNPKASKGTVYLGLAIDQNKSILRKLDLETWKYEDLILPIANPHAVTQSPDDPNELFIFDFQGSAVKINSKTEKFVTERNGHYLGHGFYDPTEDIIWCSELVGNTGLVRARNGKDLTLIKDKNFNFPAGHHVTKLPETNTLVSSGSNGKEHFVTYYDYKKRSLVNKVPSKYLGVHVLPLSENETVAVTTEHDLNAERIETFRKTLNPTLKNKLSLNELQFAGHSPLVYTDVSGNIKYVWDENRKELFQLGLGLDKIKNSGKLITSHTSSNVIIVWDNEAIEKVISAPSPLVIVATNDGASVVAQSEGIIRMYSLKTGQLEKEVIYDRPVQTLSKY